VKKIFISLLTAVYLLSAIGVSASSFYCCGILKSTTFSIGDHGSDNKVAAKTDHCCKTTKQSFKVKDNHYGAGTFSLSAKFFPVILPFSLVKLNDDPYTRVYTAFNSHAPPFRQHAPVYLLNCTYRI
jgi:hypothetical protein